MRVFGSQIDHRFAEQITFTLALEHVARLCHMERRLNLRSHINQMRIYFADFNSNNTYVPQDGLINSTKRHSSCTPKRREEKLTSVDGKMVIQLWDVFSHWCSSFETDSQNSSSSCGRSSSASYIYVAEFASGARLIENKRNSAISLETQKNTLTYSIKHTHFLNETHKTQFQPSTEEI